MKILMLSDIHSNLEALQAVIEDAAKLGGFEKIWCMGDIVGYGPDPAECLSLLREYPLLWIAGNHDYAACGKLDISHFNSYALDAILWTAEQLTEQERDFLSRLPKRVTDGEFTLVHGSMKDPIWEYLVEEYVAVDTFRRIRSPHCAVGHSHLPFVCRETGTGVEFMDLAEERVQLNGQRAIINPGSVGQPRDGDPRSSYCLYDSSSRTMLHRRVVYDIEKTREKMRSAGLPAYLSNRLIHGR